jgi:hypothetical protein
VGWNEIEKRLNTLILIRLKRFSVVLFRFHSLVRSLPFAGPAEQASRLKFMLFSPGKNVLNQIASAIKVMSDRRFKQDLFVEMAADKSD